MFNYENLSRDRCVRPLNKADVYVMDGRLPAGFLFPLGSRFELRDWLFLSHRFL